MLTIQNIKKLLGKPLPTSGKGQWHTSNVDEFSDHYTFAVEVHYPTKKLMLISLGRVKQKGSELNPTNAQDYYFMWREGINRTETIVWENDLSTLDSMRLQMRAFIQRYS